MSSVRWSALSEPEGNLSHHSIYFSFCHRLNAATNRSTINTQLCATSNPAHSTLNICTLDTGHWTFAHRTLDIARWKLDIGLWTLDIGHWTWHIVHYKKTQHATFQATEHTSIQDRALIDNWSICIYAENFPHNMGSEQSKHSPVVWDAHLRVPQCCALWSAAEIMRTTHILIKVMQSAHFYIRMGQIPQDGDFGQNVAFFWKK